MRLDIVIPKGINVPGIKGEFYNGPLDDVARKYGEKFHKEQP